MSVCDIIDSLKLWRIRRLKYISLFKLILENLSLSTSFSTKENTLHKPSIRLLIIIVVRKNKESHHFDDIGRCKIIDS